MNQDILLVGGTHGNEMTGIQLFRYWQSQPQELERQGLSIKTLLANPEAVKLGRRYVDFDLNRSFTPTLLDPAQPSSSIDVQRAREINQLYGPRGSDQVPDLVIDMHNSTAAMGHSLIINQPAPMTRCIAAHLAKEFPSVHILQEPRLGENNPYLPSLGKMDLTIEVGPQAHGTLDSNLFFSTRKLVLRTLDLIVKWNQGELKLGQLPTIVYQQKGVLDYPRYADGSPAAMIHPDRIGQDYVSLNPGEPIFMDFDGKSIPWQGPQTIWPCFIGEAAYLEKNIALLMLHKTEELW